MEKISIGIIGSGGIARGAHLPNYQKMDQVDILAVADINLETAKKAGEDYDVPHIFTDYEELLKIEEIDAVSICTPNAFHASPSIAALQMGKHVLCEKPMAVNAQEGAAMVEAAKETNKILQIGLASRFTPQSEYLKGVIESGRLGEIYYGRAVSMRRRGIPSWGVFIRKDMSGGGTLYDIGVHAIDHVIWLMGAPKPVSAFGAAMTKFGHRHDVINSWGPWDVENFDVDDFAAGSVRFENGALLTIESAWASNIEDIGGSFILGTDGGVHVIGDKVYEQRNGKLAETPLQLPSGGSGHQIEIERFIEAIRNDLPSPVDPEEVLNVQKIMDAIYQSSETEQSVTIG